MAWYRTGTVNVTNNSTTVVGVGTAWVQAASVGETFLGPDSNVYEITAISSNTSLSISPAYRSGTSTAQSYAIMPTQGYLRDLAAQAAALVASYAAVRDGAGAGKFAAGTEAAPSLRGAGDENTGVRFAGSDVLQLITNGASRLQLAADGTPTGVTADKLRDRTTHTGAQAISTVTGLQTALDAKATQTALNDLAAASVAQTNVGSAPNELPSNQHLGAMAFLDTLGATQVTQHARDSQPGDVWHEWVSNTQLRKKFHGLDGVIRTITETYA